MVAAKRLDLCAPDRPPSRAALCLAEGVTDTAAASTYSKKQTPPVPSGRYGSTSVAYKNQLWMFAGTDGGYSKHGNGGYELGESTPRHSRSAFLCPQLLSQSAALRCLQVMTWTSSICLT